MFKRNKLEFNETKYFLRKLNDLKGIIQGKYKY